MRRPWMSSQYSARCAATHKGPSPSWARAWWTQRIAAVIGARACLGGTVGPGDRSGSTQSVEGEFHRGANSLPASPAMSRSSEPLIAVDWGTSNRRAYLLDLDGRVLDEMEDELG